MREGDTVVIWKLDQLGRSLAHLVEVVNSLEHRGVGLISLNDPVNTTMTQRRLVFRIFASLIEFEREIIREPTQAGLASAFRRGQQRAECLHLHLCPRQKFIDYLIITYCIFTV
ncbi:recombinase family protein [Spirosoma aerophilum]